MERIFLSTRRLTLVAATEEMAAAESLDRARFARLLGARVPATWPPPLNDAATMAFLRAMLEGKPEVVGWAAWYWLLPPGSGEGLPVAIGNGGFMGLPDADGQVEVGYSVLGEYQGQGFATEAVGALVARAFDDARVTRIVAHTLAERNASQRVLEKLGFRRAGAGSEPGTVRFELVRAGRAARGDAR